MTNAIVASSSTLSGGVLTVTFKVSAGTTPSSNFDFLLTFDSTKVGPMTSANVSGPVTEPPGGFSTAANTSVAGQITIGSFAGDGIVTIGPNDVALTVRFPLANAADTTLNFTYSGVFGEQAQAVTIPSTAVQAGHNFLNSPAAGNVTITGTVTEDQVLTANTSGITDGDGMGTLSYQWLRDGTAVTGATSATYSLGDADVGKAMSVRVSFTDGNGNAESRTSTATANVVNVNDAPTGTVTTTGAAVVGATLTAANSLADADGMGTVLYQWNLSGTPISGATGPTLAVVEAYLGATLSVTATYLDGHGTTETRTSVATAAVGPNSAPTGTVTIAGTPAEGQTLTASNDLADTDGIATAITYQWSADGISISGATGSTLVLTQAQVGKVITVSASYTDSLGAVQGKTSAGSTAVANVDQAPTGTVTITGTAAEDQTLTAANTLADVDGMGTVTYQWMANGANISGATGSTVMLTQAEVGKTVTVKATYTDLQNTTHNVTSGATAAVANVNDAPTGGVTFTGTATQGQVLTAANTLADEDGVGTVSYQWLSNGTAIAGATGSTFTLGQAQVGTAVSVRASYVDLQGTPESATSTASASVANINDTPTGAITASGVTSVNQTLTATSTLVDPDGLGAFSYQWIRDTTDVAGATGQTYALTSADLGARMSVRVTYTDGFGQLETSTSAQSAIIVPNTPPGGAVTVTGTMAQNQVLTVSNSLTDADNGVGTVSYQWLADGTAITGATGTTFTLTEAQVGKIVTARASYTDGLGTPETKDSVSTTAVANVNDPNTGTVTIAGTAAQNQVLTATATLADIDGMGTVGFQWLADGAVISGATGSTLTLGQAQVNKLISVRASFTDGHGTLEQRSSVSTARVTNVNDAATGMPVLLGAPTQGVTLLVNSSSIADADGLGNLNYQWLADGAAIAGAINSSLTLTQAQVGKAISVRTYFTDGFGNVESIDSAASSPVANVNDVATGSVLIDGSAVVGMPLTAMPTLADIDGLGTFAYQWLVDGAVIAGATAKTFAPTSTQAGKAVSVKVSFTDALGGSESVTSSTVNVASEDDVTPLAAPGIAPVVGDGNGDGLKDSTQVQVVSAPFSKVGSSGVTENSFITLVVDSSTTGTVNNGATAVITSIDQQAIPTTGTGKAPPKMTAPLGLIDFTATVATGQTETFTLFADRSLGINGYWKQDASGKWVNLASTPYGGATTPVGNKMRLDFKITDGGEFDNDHVANGVIADPGAIAAMPLSLVGYAPDVTLTATTHFFF